MDKKITGDINKKNSLGLAERELLMQLIGPQEPLAYPTEDMRMANGCVVKKYIIPDADKGKVLNEVYPFAGCPRLDDVRIDIHTGKKFTVRDYIVTREGDLNVLVTPYYAEAGGTVLDWIECADDDDAEDDGGDTIIRVRTVKSASDTATLSAVVTKA